MTQMMLFDSQALVGNALAGNPAPATPVVIPTDSPTSTPIAAVSSAVVSSAAASRSKPDLGDGVHHMGDLARLVLLRYELMAKRRAEFAARKAESATRRRSAR